MPSGVKNGKETNDLSLISCNKRKKKSLQCWKPQIL